MKGTVHMKTVISPSISLPDAEKLSVLRRLDQLRQWHSLDDKRYCLVCGKMITGHQIQVVVGTRRTVPCGLAVPRNRQIKAESWENCAESFGICSGDAPVKEIKADAPPLQFRLPESRPGGQSQNYQHRLKLAAASQRLILTGERIGLRCYVRLSGVLVEFFG